MLIQMCDFPSVDKEIPNWETINDLYFEKYREKETPKYMEEKKPLTVYFDYLIRYCDNCDTIMYWPYVTAYANSTVHVMADPKYNDSIAKELTLAEERLNKSADMVKADVKITTICPVCGKPLLHNRGFYDEVVQDFYRIKRFSNLDWQKDVEKHVYEGRWMTRHREKYYKEADEITAKNEYEKSIKGISDAALTGDIQPVENIVPEKIKGSVDGLCEYLSHALELEQNIYMIEKRLEAIINRLPGIQREARHATGRRTQGVLLEKIDQEKRQLKDRLNEISGFSYSTFGLSRLPLPEKPIAPVQPKEPEYEKPSFFNKKKVLAQNAALEQKYKEEVAKYKEDNEKYNSSMGEYNKECIEILKRNKAIKKELEEKKNNLIQKAKDESNERISRIKSSGNNANTLPEVAIEQIILEELQLAKDTYRDLLIARERYYLSDVIFGKYRQFAIVATMYEYLKSGRCTALEGPNGAYNLYESELRANTIIAKLDVVIEKLDEIKNAQYMLCSTLERINTNLSRIDTKMRKACASLASISNSSAVIRDNSDVIKNNSALIEYNTEKTAFYSKMTASISAAMLFGF